MLSRMPDKQAANLIATGSMVQRTYNVERVMDPKLSLPACRRANNGVMWMLENLLELPARKLPRASWNGGGIVVLRGGCLAKRLTLLAHQPVQASLSTGAGGVGMSSVEARRMPASVGSLVAALPAVLADSSGSLGEKVRRNLPDSELVTVCARECEASEMMERSLKKRWAK